MSLCIVAEDFFSILDSNLNDASISMNLTVLYGFAMFYPL